MKLYSANKIKKRQTQQGKEKHMIQASSVMPHKMGVEGIVAKITALMCDRRIVWWAALVRIWVCNV